MTFSRLFAAASAAALAVAAPLSALAQDATPSAPPASAPPSATAPSAPTAAPMEASPHLMPNGNLVATLKGSGAFTILVRALDQANLSSVLAATPDLTLFAPTDEAFRALPPRQLAALMAPKNAPVLQQILTYHLVHLNLDSSKFKGAKGPVETVEKGNLVIDGSGDVLKVNNADIIQSDVKATNGFIQVVDKVLIPSDVTLPVATADAGATTPAGR